MRLRQLGVALALGFGLAASTVKAQPAPRDAPPLPIRASALLELDDFDTPLIEGPILCPGLPDEHPFHAKIAPPEETEPEAPAEDEEAETGADTAETDGEAEEAEAEAEAEAAEAPPVLTPIESAIVEAREATEHEAQRPARERLRRRLARTEADELAGCAEIELARLELRMRLFPEAAATALRARDLEQPLQARHDEASRLIQAEALYRSGDPLRAAPLFLRLVQATTPRYGVAANLRLADIRFDRGMKSAVLEDYQKLLPQTEILGLDAKRWEPRLLAAAVDAGELGEVERYIRYKLRTIQSPILSLRLSDVLAARGKTDEAQQILVNLTAYNDPSDLATLARMRLFEWDLEDEDEAGPIVALEREIELAESRALAIYGKTLLARRQIEAGRSDLALRAMVPIAHDPREPLFLDVARDLISRAMRIAEQDVIGTAGCGKLIETVGDRQGLTLRRSNVASPFLTLGRCYEHYSLNRAALRLYRALARHFGGDVAADVALPIARTSLAIGEVTGARAAAQIRVDQGTANAAWRQLLGATLLADEEYTQAFDVLSELAIEQPEPETLYLLTRAARRIPLEAAERERFTAAVATLGQEKGSTLGLAKLHAGRIHREAGELDLAAQRYQEAEDALRRGPLDAEARYWNGRLSSTGMSPSADPDDAPYARLTGEQARLEQLRQRAGIPPRNDLE